jgi:prephenate dehydrogenase
MGSIASRAPVLAVVGDGLIGRSVRLAWLRRHPEAEVRSLDRGSDLAALAATDIVVLATPVDAILEMVPQLPQLAPRASLIVDTGSTKQAIAARAQAAGLQNFVAGHPMAGGSTTGPSGARADLFDGRTWLLVVGGVNEELREQARRFVQALGAVPVETPDRGALHDRVVAAVSHLPQIVASALLARVGESVGADGLRWSGGGLRDTTRLAESHSDIWRSIVATNQEAIAPLLKALAADLDALADRLDDPGAIDELFSRAHRWLPQNEVKSEK